MMAPLYCLRGTEDGVRFFETALKEMEEKVRMGTGPLPEERFRFVIEGPPPWPYLRTFRDLFSKWGAVAVASTYSTVGGLWEFGFRHGKRVSINGKPLASNQKPSDISYTTMQCNCLAFSESTICIKPCSTARMRQSPRFNSIDRRRKIR